MSVYIKGMEMPKSCHVCVAGYGGCCYVAPAETDGICPDHDKPEWCPLVPVPPHGRLGDLDKLEQMFVDIDNAPYSGFDGSEPFYSAEDAAQIIRLSPTIIPAEEGDG